MISNSRTYALTHLRTPFPLPIVVLVSGSGTNLQAIIDEIGAGQLDAEIKMVISNNPDVYAINRCKKHKIPFKIICQPDFEVTIVQEVVKSGAKLICLAGFMKILSKDFVKKFKGQIINIHPALLPSFPGLRAQGQALLYGAKISGCTVHFVNEDVDTGPIIIQAAVPLLENDTEETLSARILKEEHNIYPQAIQLFAEGRLKIVGRRVLISDKKCGS